MAINLIRFLVNYLIMPPLTVLGYLLEPAWALFGLSNKQVALRNQRELEQDVRSSLSFLFDEQNGCVIPNRGVPFPPGFDYAFVTVAVDDVLFRFCRGRGDLDIRVAAKNAPNDLYDLSIVLALMETENSDPQRWNFATLPQASRLLRPKMDRLKHAFDGAAARDLKQRLADVRASDQIAIRQAEWEINKRLKN
jgi:hypothetical protein